MVSKRFSLKWETIGIKCLWNWKIGKIRVLALWRVRQLMKYSRSSMTKLLKLKRWRVPLMRKFLRLKLQNGKNGWISHLSFQNSGSKSKLYGFTLNLYSLRQIFLSVSLLKVGLFKNEWIKVIFFSLFCDFSNHWFLIIGLDVC